MNTNKSLKRVAGAVLFASVLMCSVPGAYAAAIHDANGSGL